MERAILDELLVNGLRDLRKDEIINGERLKVKVVATLAWYHRLPGRRPWPLRLRLFHIRAVRFT